MNNKGMRKGWRMGAALGVVVIVTLVFAAVALASNGAAIEWWVIAGGGAGASSGDVSLESTLGQALTGVSYGDGLSLCAGYWCGEQPALIYLPMLRH